MQPLYSYTFDLELIMEHHDYMDAYYQIKDEVINTLPTDKEDEIVLD